MLAAGGSLTVHVFISAEVKADTCINNDNGKEHF